MRTALRRVRGFTLLEVLMAAAIVAVLASVAVPLLEVSARRAKEQELRLALREIRGALDAYRLAVEEGRVAHSLQESGYPRSLAVLVQGVPDASSPDGKRRIHFLRRIPRDPLFADPQAPPEDGWGKRSYASPADAPEEGEDVFDVHSLAPGVGLNGVPYAQW